MSKGDHRELRKEGVPTELNDRVFPRNLRRRYPTAVRGEGVYLYDSDGRRYLDGCAGALVANVGHGNVAVARALARQAETLSFAHGSRWTTEPAQQLADLLSTLAPGDLKHVYFTSSGSEAVEAAVKMARQFFVERDGPGTLRWKAIGRDLSFHGSTLGALSVGGHHMRRSHFSPLLKEMPKCPPCYCYRCPLNKEYPDCRVACAEELEATILAADPETVAAFIVEPVVGAALGAVPPQDGYLENVRRICTKYGVLLIADEVMSGIGRTGRAFAVDHWGVIPDLIIAAKGLGAGYVPLGAVLVGDAICQVFRDGSSAFNHGQTYDGHPIACAGGVAVLRYILEHRLVERAAANGAYLLDGLRALRRHAMVGDVRGLGLMCGVELVADRQTKQPFDRDLCIAERVNLAAMERGLVLYPGQGNTGDAGDHLLIGPPLIITRSEIDELLTALDGALASIASEVCVR